MILTSIIMLTYTRTYTSTTYMYVYKIYFYFAPLDKWNMVDNVKIAYNYE